MSAIMQSIFTWALFFNMSSFTNVRKSGPCGYTVILNPLYQSVFFEIKNTEDTFLIIIFQELSSAGKHPIYIFD